MTGQKNGACRDPIGPIDLRSLRMTAPERAPRLHELGEVFAALAHPARREILMAVHFRGGAMTAGEIAGRFGHAWPTTTRHLRVLEAARLLTHEPRGRERVYALQRKSLELVTGWVRWFFPPSPRAAAAKAAKNATIAAVQPLRPRNEVARASGKQPARPPKQGAQSMTKTYEALTRMREICLSLPDTKETLTWGQPHFRVGEKIFAGCGEEKGKSSIGFKLELDHADAILGDPRFTRAPYVGHKGWVSMDAQKVKDWEEVRLLVHESYRLIAPKKSYAKLATVPAATEAPVPAKKKKATPAGKAATAAPTKKAAVPAKKAVAPTKKAAAPAKKAVAPAKKAAAPAKKAAPRKAVAKKSAR